MRYPFRRLPALGGSAIARPVVDIWLEGIAQAPLASLIDTGALRTRFAGELAEIAGINLDGTPRERFAVGGVSIEGAAAHVTLQLGSGSHAEIWEAPVWFCYPWPFGFQLLGLDGFLRHFRVTMSAYHEWTELRREG